MMRRLCVLSLVFLFLLALCIVPPVIGADPPPSSSTKKKSTSSSSPSSSSSSSPSPSSSSPSPPTPPQDEREARATRKTTRVSAYQRRIDQQTRRIKEKASKQTKKYSDSRKKRLNSLMLKAQKEVKAAQKSESYWVNKRESTAPAVLKKGEKKLSSIASLSSSIGMQKVIRLQSKEFNDLIVTSPRPYWVLLSLTALSPSYDCKICGVVHDAFNELAPVVHPHSHALLNGTGGGFSGYNSLLQFNGTMTAAERERLQREFDDEVKKSLPIFIVEADIDDNRKAFTAMQLTSAPTMVLLPPSFSAKPPAVAGLLASVAGKYRYIPQSLDINAGTFIDFINQHIEPNIEKVTAGGSRGWMEMINAKVRAFNPAILLYFSIILAGLLLFFVISIYRLYCRRTPNPKPFSFFNYFLPSSQITSYTVSASSISGLNFYGWGGFGSRLPLVISAITFYFFCVSGGMFTVIKESEAGYETTSSGGWVYKDWISQQYMDQTVAESTVLAFLYLCLFALIVFLNSRTFYVKKIGEGWSLQGVGGWLLSWLLSPVFVVVLIGLVYLQLVNVYGKKNSYHWGWNWRWLNSIQWQKVIPYPAVHRYTDELWKLILKRMW